MSKSNWVNRMPNRSRRFFNAFTAVAMLVGLIAPLAMSGVASASTVSSAAFSGGAGTASVGGTLYAKSGGALTLTVNTSSDTQCVDVSGGLTGHQQSGTAKSTWTFSFTAGDGDGVQGVTATASPSFNAQNKCNGNSGSAQASYTLDNTGPVVTASISPAPNGAGWNKDNVSITWSATDTGSGVSSGPNPATDSQNSNTAGVTKTASATDRLGNIGDGSVTVKLDKMNPTITGSRSPAANSNGWNNTDVTVSFTCSDGLSGVKSCTGPTTLTNSAANQAVTGNAVDIADNSASAMVSNINIDKVAPTLSGAPTTSPNSAGWYNSNVTIHWTAADALSGLAGAAPADIVISSEGTGLTASASVSDKAGNTTNATSSPAVKIDKTAPNTTATAPVNWNNADVTVTLNAADALSGVAATFYKLDGGTQQSGTSVSISAEGMHTLQFWSVDNAGNTEGTKSVQVKIDKTPPTINHTQSPAANAKGWNNTNVTVTFVCNDSLSGIASCTDPQTVTTEGKNQTVTGTAIDNAGNTATDPATVSIDKTAPTISAASDRAANGNGWYNADVTVSFTCGDALSGIDTCPGAAILGEGADQTASGTATDAAGNTSSASASGISVDKTAPSLSGAATTAPNGNGWYNGDVTIHWTASDDLSGLDGSVLADSSITGEGDNLSASASVSDKAGNLTSETLSGIKIDRTAPSTLASVPAPLASGWYAGDVEVSLTTGVDLSGIAKIYYSVDDGAAQEYTAPFQHTVKGVHTITFWSVDNAGNVEDKTAPGHSIVLKIDGNAPTTTIINPISPDSGWFVTSGIPFAFAATDTESGIAATYYTIDGGDPQTYGDPFTADLSTGAHEVTYWSVDLAGNAEETKTLSIKVDTIAPTITGSATPGPNGFGWNNTDVNVTFTCIDADSGINGVAGCAGDTNLANEGMNQMVHGDAVDVAGNRSSTDLGPVNIDKTKPTLTGAATTDANAASWYKNDVTIHWTGVDALSGIDPATQPADSVVTGEGSNLTAGPATIKDKASNVSDPASVTGIKIDRTAPVITGVPTTSPNAAGWYKDEVIVDFTCNDPKLADGTDGSGVASCPTSKLIKGDGANQSVTSDPATDVAGNASSGKTVGGFNIDGTAPTTLSDNQCTKSNGWCTGATANVVLTATDQTGLSGVKEIRYKVNGGAEQVAAGTTKTVSVPLDGSGEATVTYYAVDKAGNVESANTVTLEYDNIAPAVTHKLNPVPNADEWNNSDVTVHFDAKDNDSGSGVDASTVTKDVVVSTETAGLLVTGSASDVAGNVGTDSVTIKLDKTKPTITAAITSGTLGNNGWYVGPVTVTFTCADALSGVATCPDPVILSANGANSASGTVTDRAGNTGSTTVSGINIDQEMPTITAVNVNGGTYTLGTAPAATCTATDSFSGLVSCAVAVSGGNANGVGTFSYTATATDKAGNVSTMAGTYRVIYEWSGFLQPINDTAHQVGTTTSIFKAGSTVPVKFQLKDASGKIVQSTAAPQWMTPVKGSATSAPIDESLNTLSATSGTAYQWDGTQYQYNWNTKGLTSGYYYQIGVKLDDGRTYYVNIGLR